MICYDLIIEKISANQLHHKNQFTIIHNIHTQINHF